MTAELALSDRIPKVRSGRPDSEDCPSSGAELTREVRRSAVEQGRRADWSLHEVLAALGLAHERVPTRFGHRCDRLLAEGVEVFRGSPAAVWDWLRGEP